MIEGEEIMSVNFLLRERIDYINDTYLKNNVDVPRSKSNDTFPDGVKVGFWINNHRSD